MQQPTATLRRPVALAAVALAAVLALTQIRSADATPVAAAATHLASAIEDVRSSDGHTYHATDSSGRTMDAAQIVQAADGSYLAVYHSVLADGRFHAAVATSTDLLHWQRRHDFGAGSSQPDLARADGGRYVLAWEQDPRNHIAVREYRDLRALLAGDADRRYDAPLTLSRCSEGTPSITSVHGSTVELTGHFRHDCDTDHQMRATLKNFTTWHAEPDERIDRALYEWGAGGNIGDRDPVVYQGRKLLLIEGQGSRDDFSTWRTYVYDPKSGRAVLAALRTHGGSTAFANPSATRITAPDGRPALLVSVFLPKEGAAAGEAGQLLYWHSL
ncbi:hypothetical protein [Streptomyces beijiangensis]|uniref:Uncharacterized protein n=1 Tax=Streptomyces beijiangensis TaxID=163361 RepID=A0A939FCE1_9ACTN|nr:hypothetical protein [Streptomyces beijiangensis]MBO0516490.1 hypothetical protein [Streptomyces beijiangensis]